MPPIEHQAVGYVLGKDDSEWIVDHKEAYHHGRDRFWALREKPKIQAQKQTVLERHGRRR